MILFASFSSFILSPVATVIPLLVVALVYYCQLVIFTLCMYVYNFKKCNTFISCRLQLFRLDFVYASWV